MRIWNRTRNNRLAEEVREARTFGARLRGWLAETSPAPGQGIYLAPCAWVHTFGMRAAVDAVYIDRQGIVRAVRTLAPGRLGPWVRGAAGVLEVPAGTCERLECGPGDQLEQIGGRGW